MNDNSWPFDQSRNCAAITLRSIVFGGAPILRITHDEDDHGWQFLGLEDVSLEDGMVIAMHAIVDFDPSVLEIADLPVGWHAIRASKDMPWQCGPIIRE